VSSKNKFAVYRNLNNGELSIQNTKTKFIIGHCKKIILKDVEYRVSVRGIEKIRKKGVKSVVAKVVGEIARIEGFVRYKGRSHGPYLVEDDCALDERVFFDPYKWDGFVDKNGSVLSKSNVIEINRDGRMYSTKNKIKGE
jgi:hypothetical protein